MLCTRARDHATAGLGIDMRRLFPAPAVQQAQNVSRTPMRALRPGSGDFGKAVVVSTETAL